MPMSVRLSPRPAALPAPDLPAARPAALPAALSVALAATLYACALPPGRDAPPPRQQASRADAPPIVSPARARQCLGQLTRQDAVFRVLPDRVEGSGCAAVNSVAMTQIAGDIGPIAVGNLSRTSCAAASTFSAWIRYGVDRAARQELGSAVAQVDTYGSYSCRNIAGTGRRSAHATASAIDVAGVKLADGRRVTVEAGWNGSDAERRFWRTARQSACRRFGTVLSPDYNAAHYNHLHLEAGGRSFCR